MPRFALLLALALKLAAQANPEDSVPREVLLVAKSKVRVEEILNHQPNYTCSQSIERSMRRPGSKRWELVDTLRLEVALVERKELFAWPGADRFDDRELRDMVGGTIGNGDFAIFTHSVFLSGVSRLAYDGEEEKDGRKLIRFKYDVARALSGYQVRVDQAHGIVGYYGTAWVDAKTFDPVRLEITTKEIPPDLPLKVSHNVVEYARIRIGEIETVLPSVSEMVIEGSEGTESRNRTTYSNCRQFTAQSSLTFEDPTPGEPVSSTPVKVQLSAGIDLPMKLTSAIKSDSLAVGDPFTAEISKDVKMDGEVRVPKGAKVTGRVMKIERAVNSKQAWWIGLRLERLTFENKIATLNARLKSPTLVNASNLPREAYTTRVERTGPTTEADENVVMVLAYKVDLRPGMSMLWRTM